MEIPSVAPQNASGNSPRWVRFVLIWMVSFVVIGMVFFDTWKHPWYDFRGPPKPNPAAKFPVEIAGAIYDFHAEYDGFPFDSPDVDWVGTTAGKDGLVAALTGKEGQEVKETNVKGINYLDGFKRAEVVDSVTVRDGIDYVTNWLGPGIYDPWGQPFIVILDTNFDSVIANPLKSGGALPLRGKKGIVYSTGPPNADGTRNTDESKFITSW